MKYDEYALDLGFKKLGKIYTLESNGYNMYLKDWEYSLLNVPSIFIPLDRPLTKEKLDKLTKAAFDNVCVSFSLGNENDTLIVTLPSGNKKKDSVKKIMIEEINNVINVLKEDGYLNMKICPICQREAEYMVFGDNYCPMHTSCKEKYVTALKEKEKEDSKLTYKYPLALFLTLLGALVGILPALLLTIFNKDYLFGGMVCFAPILGTISYALAKAPSKKWLKISAGIIMFLVVISFIIFSQIYISKSLELSYGDYIKYNGYTGLRRLIFGILLSFGGFGCLRTLRKFRKDSNKELKKFEEE